MTLVRIFTLAALLALPCGLFAQDKPVVAPVSPQLQAALRDAQSLHDRLAKELQQEELYQRYETAKRLLETLRAMVPKIEPAKVEAPK